MCTSNPFFFLSCSTGSAFTVKVTGEGRMKESITRKRTAASVANVGSQCDLSLKIPGKHHHFVIFELPVYICFAQVLN